MTVLIYCVGKSNAGPGFERCGTCATNDWTVFEIQIEKQQMVLPIKKHRYKMVQLHAPFFKKLFALKEIKTFPWTALTKRFQSVLVN